MEFQKFILFRKEVSSITQLSKWSNNDGVFASREIELLSLLLTILIVVINIQVKSQL
mgnify:CR=1 FL=1